MTYDLGESISRKFTDRMQERIDPMRNPPKQCPSCKHKILLRRNNDFKCPNCQKAIVKLFSDKWYAIDDIKIHQIPKKTYKKSGYRI